MFIPFLFSFSLPLSPSPLPLPPSSFFFLPPSFSSFPPSPPFWGSTGDRHFVSSIFPGELVYRQSIADKISSILRVRGSGGQTWPPNISVRYICSVQKPKIGVCRCRNTLYNVRQTNTWANSQEDNESGRQKENEKQNQKKKKNERSKIKNVQTGRQEVR